MCAVTHQCRCQLVTYVSCEVEECVVGHVYGGWSAAESPVLHTEATGSSQAVSHLTEEQACIQDTMACWGSIASIGCMKHGAVGQAGVSRVT